ncbi:MAG: lipoyl(octanoyl) transferase LipB [Tannerellaceae bacterium]|jgi:lipoyl(octanoyl) transferase|nr:lipoyl(octanoyl) transferase LipB [Tannerellaceae bacterium]
MGTFSYGKRLQAIVRRKIENNMAAFLFKDLGRTGYEEALKAQTTAFERLLEQKKNRETGDCVLFFCEHNHVYTTGKNGNESNLLASEELLKTKGATLFHANRGGDITYHGAGQITGYPVFDLERWGIGLKEYIFRLEEVVIRFLALYGLRGERMAGATGVWIDAAVPGKARKICAIGVKSSRYVTMHGFALNVNTDLSYFSLINPCGFTDKGVTSLARELGETQDFEKAKKDLYRLFISCFNR